MSASAAAPMDYASLEEAWIEFADRYSGDDGAAAPGLLADLELLRAGFFAGAGAAVRLFGHGCGDALRRDLDRFSRKGLQ